MKKMLIVLCLLFVAIGGYAQQEAQYTQFMYNKLSINPAYAGSSEMPCISCIHRSQWIGFEGAPSSQVINFHAPAFGKRVGLGASFAHDKIGPTNTYAASLMYAYRMKLSKGNLSFGFKGTLVSYRVNWQKLEATHTGDEEIPMEVTNRVFPNFGAGAYYTTSNFYIGLSVPTVISNDLSFSELANNSDFGKKRRHFYLMAGYVMDINKNLQFKPATLIKYVTNAPLDLDLNATFIFLEKLWTGLSYRLGGDSTKGVGESIDLLVQYQITKTFRAGISYDFTLSEMRKTSSGTAEIQLEYCIPSKKDQQLNNPRFF